MIKIMLKLLKYGIVIYLLIFFKNLYSETFFHNPVITVQKPDIVGMQEIQTAIDEHSSFAEQMDFFGSDNQEQLENQIEAHKKLKQDSATIDSYKQSLELGINQPAAIDIEPALPGLLNNKKERRQLRGVTPGFDSYNQNNFQQDPLPVPPAIIELE